MTITAKTPRKQPVLRLFWKCNSPKCGVSGTCDIHPSSMLGAWLKSAREAHLAQALVPGCKGVAVIYRSMLVTEIDREGTGTGS